jgi:hypothetical protein
VRHEDLLAGMELSEKLLDGRLGIALYCRECGGIPKEEDDSPHLNHTCGVEYRFFKEKR